MERGGDEREVVVKEDEDRFWMKREVSRAVGDQRPHTHTHIVNVHEMHKEEEDEE